MTESLCNELFWTFKKEDFKHALACFIFDDIEDEEDSDEDYDTTVLIRNITMRFNKFLQVENNGTITDWAKEMYKKVCYRFIIFKIPYIYLYYPHLKIILNLIYLTCSMASCFQKLSTSKYWTTET